MNSAVFQSRDKRFNDIYRVRHAPVNTATLAVYAKKLKCKTYHNEA
jgi:hypothetical protein